MKELNKILEHHVSIHESEVDPQEIWEGILEKQKPTKRRRFLFYFKMFLPIVLLVGLSPFILTDEDQADIAMLQPVENHTPVSEYQRTANPLSSIKEKTAQHLGVSTSTKTVSTTELNVASASTNEYKEATTVNESLSTSELKISNFTSPFRQVKTPVSNQKNTIQISAINSNSNFATKKISRPKLNLPLLPILISPFKNFEQTIPSKEIVVNRTFNQATLTLGLTGGMGYIHSHSSIQNPASTYLAARSDSEKPLEAINVNLEAMLLLPSSWSLGTGLRYSRLSEELDWTDKYLTDSAGNILSTIETDTEGNSISDFSSANQNELLYSDEIRSVHYNSHYFIDLPISLGYEKILGRIRTNIFAGTAFNVLSRSEGRYLNQDLLISEYGMDSKLKASLSYRAGFQMQFPLANRLAFLSRLEYENRKFTHLGYYKRYSTISLNIGMNYSF